MTRLRKALRWLGRLIRAILSPNCPVCGQHFGQNEDCDNCNSAHADKGGLS